MLSKGLAPLRMVMGGNGLDPEIRVATLARGGEEHAALARVDRVILKEIIFVMIALDGFQQVNYPQSFSTGAWRR